MRIGSFAAVAVGLMCSIRMAHADPKADIQAKLKEAMESYDLIEYDAAKKALNQAIAVAKKAKLEKDPLVARAYLDLGIVAFAVPDLEGAKVSFLSAVQIDPKIQIDAAYKSAELSKLLDEARSEAGGSAGGSTSAAVEPSGPADPAVDCKSVKGLQHTLIDTAKGGVALPIEALLASNVKPAKVAIMYRVEGKTDFAEVKMTGQGCKYTGQIPAASMKGSLVHYYVAAFDGNGKPIASKGSAGSPNIIEVSAASGAAAVVKGDDEDPLGGHKVVAKPVETASASSSSSTTTSSSSAGEVDTGVPAGPLKAQKIMLAVSGGTGTGYVSGATEGMNTVKNCCFGNATAVVIAELGYFVNPRTSVGLAIRLGFPLGANVDGHATLAPGAMLRMRYALDPTGNGIHVMGQIGAGILRNTIKLDNPAAGMDTDIVAQGPLLIGGGVGYAKRLSNNVAFLADFSLLAGIAVTSSLGSAPALTSGISGDLSLGLALGF